MISSQPQPDNERGEKGEGDPVPVPRGSPLSVYCAARAMPPLRQHLQNLDFMKKKRKKRGGL